MWPFRSSTEPAAHAARLASVIDNELEQRGAEHRKALMARVPGSHLNFLADGDSWFDYPISDGWFGLHSDVLTQLRIVSTVEPTILSLAHYGYTSTQEMGLVRQQRMVEAFRNGGNGHFDAILFSGGGNDIAGDALPIWLNDAEIVGHDIKQAIDATRLDGALSLVRASYLDLIALRDDCAPGVPIFVHDYDFAIPSGKPATVLGVYKLGPWLKPALDYCGWTDPDMARSVVASLMTRFAAMLEELSAQPENNFVHVRTQGTLNTTQWANELHPTVGGFRLIARALRLHLAMRFPGQI